MPPAAKRHMSVIVYDLACEKQRDFEKSLKKLLHVKWNQTTRDTCKVLAMNSNKSQNKYDYAGICTVTEEILYTNPQRIFENMPARGEDRSNWLEALKVACDVFIEEGDCKGVLTKQLTIFSDFNHDSNDHELLDDVVKLINNNNIFLYVFGPPIQPNIIVKSPTDVNNWMSNDKALDNLPNSQNFSVLKQIVNKTKHRVVCDLNLSVHMFCSYKSNHESQAWPEPLVFCQSLKLPSQTMKVLNKGKLDITFRNRHKDVIPYVNALNPEEIFEYFDIIKCVERHDKFIPIRDEKRFHVEGDRCFRFLGFTDKENVPEYYLRGDGAYFVKATNPFVESLIKVCKSENVYGIVKRIYNKNNNPKYYALLPVVCSEGNHFIMPQLPYAEDIKMAYKEKPVKLAPEVQIEPEVEKYLDDLKVNMMPTMLLTPTVTKFAEYSLNKEEGFEYEENQIQMDLIPDDHPFVKKFKNLL